MEIRVEDTGIDIPKDPLSAIFEPFRQLENVSTRRFNGTGLGLHIVKRLLDLVGGQVTVECEVGRGSAFWVWAPTGYNKIGQNDTEDTNVSSQEQKLSTLPVGRVFPTEGFPGDNALHNLWGSVPDFEPDDIPPALF